MLESGLVLWCIPSCYKEVLVFETRCMSSVALGSDVWFITFGGSIFYARLFALLLPSPHPSFGWLLWTEFRDVSLAAVCRIVAVRLITPLGGPSLVCTLGGPSLARGPLWCPEIPLYGLILRSRAKRRANQHLLSCATQSGRRRSEETIKCPVFNW